MRASTRVAGVVAPLVVDALEVVDVEEDHGDRAAVAPGARQLDLGALVEAAPVQQAGERVGPAPRSASCASSARLRRTRIVVTTTRTEADTITSSQRPG